MIMGVRELQTILEEIYEKIAEEITFANRTGDLDSVLDKYGFSDNEETNKVSYVDPNRAKILLVHDNRIKIKDLYGIMKKYDIDKKHLEDINYDEAKSFNWYKLKDTTEYTDIFIGAIPHKVKGLDGESSIVTKIEKNPHEYPKLHKLTSSNALKISKSNFEEALKKSNFCAHL